MLLRFGVRNFGSIRDYQELSFIASDAIKDDDSGLLTQEGFRFRALPALLLYGANASGKSWVFRAIRSMSTHVVNSFTASKPESPIRSTPFALDSKNATEPTQFDCDFLIGEERYHYGFSLTSSAFEDEWLYAIRDGHRRLLFYRRKNSRFIDFGKSLRGRNKSIEEFMRPNSLFLSVAAQNSHEQLTPLYRFFKDRLDFHQSSAPASLRDSVGYSIDGRILSFLRHADTGIVDARVEREPATDDVKEFYSSLRSLVKVLNPDAEVDPPNEVVIYSFSHTGKDGNHVFLPFDSESQGTKLAFGLLAQIYKSLDSGAALIVDEIDTSLHSLIAVELVKLFQQKRTNKNNAQILATTHDTNLLCSKIIRRDQVWFTEKDSDGSTSLFPLTDLRTRSSDNLEKGYLQGRFGAIPFMGSADELFGSVA